MLGSVVWHSVRIIDIGGCVEGLHLSCLLPCVLGRLRGPGVLLVCWWCPTLGQDRDNVKLGIKLINDDWPLSSSWAAAAAPRGGTTN